MDSTHTYIKEIVSAATFITASRYRCYYVLIIVSHGLIFEILTNDASRVVSSKA